MEDAQYCPNVVFSPAPCYQQLNLDAVWKRISAEFQVPLVGAEVGVL